LFWGNCGDVIWMSDARLDEWKARGAGGFVCVIGFVRNMGGSQDFTGDPSASLAGSNYDTQRAMRDTNIVARAAARGLKMYLGFYLASYYNPDTPFTNWYDNAGWTTISARIGELASAARQLGFAGVAFDEELYPGAGSPGTWEWNYPGNTHSEAEVRAQVKARGRQLMAALVGGFPGLEIVDYGTYFPEGWEEYVQHEVNGVTNARANWVQIDLWDGLTSQPGYGPIRFMNAIFYKTSHLNGSTWDTAFTYDANRFFAFLSRRLSNFANAAPLINWSPFAWVSDGTSAFESARSPDYVAAQLAAFRRWGMGGTFANYAYQGVSGFDYTPYEAGLKAASTAGAVDTTAPTLTVDQSTVTATGITVTGSASDNFAIRDIRWSANGASGTAPMIWTVTAGDYRSGYQWRMSWTATIPLTAGANTVTISADDIKSLTTTTTLTVTGDGGKVLPPTTPPTSQPPPPRALPTGGYKPKTCHSINRTGTRGLLRGLLGC
jgi:hypothetical protein